MKSRRVCAGVTRSKRGSHVRKGPAVAARAPLGRKRAGERREIIIAAVSPWVAYGTEQTNQQPVAAQHRLVTENAWPLVEQSSHDEYTSIRSSSTRTQTVDTYTVTNAGAGPAKMEGAELYRHGRACPSWPAAPNLDFPAKDSAPVDRPVAHQLLSESGSTPYGRTGSATLRNSSVPFEP